MNKRQWKKHMKKVCKVLVSQLEKNIEIIYDKIGRRKICREDFIE